MSKRFTDTKKWKNQWFRELSTKAKLTWIYLCDECESHGVCKIDWGMAKFQLGFDINKELLIDWFGDKIHIISDDKILIVQFFEFQYGESKDTWSAKVEARKKLENLGFTIINNKLQVPFISNQTQSPHSPPTSLIRGIGIVKGNSLEEKEILDFWNNQKELPKLTKLTESRKTKLNLRLKEMGLDKLKQSIICLTKSKFHLGENSTKWKADFDWFFKNEENPLKLLEKSVKTNFVQDKTQKSLQQIEHEQTLSKAQENSTGMVDVKELIKNTRLKSI